MNVWMIRWTSIAVAIAVLGTCLAIAGDDSKDNSLPPQVAYEHVIRLRILEVTPLEKLDKINLLQLKVQRHYGKIETKSLERNRERETQQFTILFPASTEAAIRVGDIIDYRITSYLALAERPEDPATPATDR